MLKPWKSFIVMLVFALFLFVSSAYSMFLVPMDDAQTDHLKAYGLVYSILKSGSKVFWLLNYRCGAFVTEDSKDVELKARISGITMEAISNTQWAGILGTIENSNMEKVTLEKAPKIAVYTPTSTLPWDDAVTLRLDIC